MVEDLEILKSIAGRLRHLPGACAVTPSHIDRPFPSIRFTFGEDDLRDALGDPDVSGAVHHGRFNSTSYAESLFLFDERVAALAPATLGPIHLSAEKLRLVLLGEISSWHEFGFERKAITPLAHGDPLHLNALCSLMNVEKKYLSPGLKTYPTYAALRDAASSVENVMVFGLRPSEASDDLRFIDVNGVSLWDNKRKNEIPGQPISLVLPRRLLSSKALGVLRTYMRAVESRATADCTRLAQLKRLDALTRVQAVA